MSKKINIDADIIEKDYYVCTVLKELASKQDYLKAYFKGGTAVYKILDTMNRFSEDIDLTVEVIKEESNNSNKTRLKKSAIGYKIPGLELDKDKTKDVKQSVGDAAKDVKQHVTGEHDKTRAKIDNASGMNEAITNVTNMLTTREDLNLEDVKALSNEIDVIKDDANLTDEQKVRLIRSISQKIGESEYFTKKDLPHIRAARNLMSKGKPLPTKDISFKDDTEAKGYYIDFDAIE